MTNRTENGHEKSHHLAYTAETRVWNNRNQGGAITEHARLNRPSTDGRWQTLASR